MALSKARRAELEAELLKTMDRQDSLKEELREKLADHREQVKLHAHKLRELRDILSGREPEQTVLPGAEVGEVKPSKARRAELEAKATKPNAAGITWTAEDDDSRTGRSRSQARVYRVSAVKVTATGKLNWGWNLPGSSLHHGGSSGFDAASQAMAAAEKHELHCWPREPKKEPPIVKKNAGPYRPKGEIVRWAADRLAKRPPTFVIEQAGLRTKKAIVAKYGENATFEKGKPTPRTASERAPKKPLPSGPISGPVSWTEGDGTLQVMVGSTTYRAAEITPTRWVLESKSERERAWHKEDVHASLNACESAVMKRHPGTTFAEVCLNCGVLADQPSKDCQECAHGREGELEDLVGTREDAVKRHAAGKAVGT